MTIEQLGELQIIKTKIEKAVLQISGEHPDSIIDANFSIDFKNYEHD